MDAADIEHVNEPEHMRGILALKVDAYLEAQRKEMFYAQAREQLCVDLVRACESGSSDAVVADIARDYIRTKKNHLLHRALLTVAHEAAGTAWSIWSGSPVSPTQHEYMRALARAIDDLREKRKLAQQEQDEKRAVEKRAVEQVLAEQRKNDPQGDGENTP